MFVTVGFGFFKQADLLSQPPRWLCLDITGMFIVAPSAELDSVL